MSTRFLVACCLVMCGITTSAMAQTNVDGRVLGQVAGLSAADLAQAVVKIKGADGGFTAQATPSADGTYRFNVVPIGDYTVTVNAAGQAEQTAQTTVRIGAASRVEFDYATTAAVVTQLSTVVVTARKAPLLAQVDTTSTEAVNVLSRELTDQLPVARSVPGVALLTPGVFRGLQSIAFDLQSTTPLISISGSSPVENNFFVNGFNITDFRKGSKIADVPFEMLQETEVRTGGYSVEYGRSLGGIVNSVTKKGADRWTFVAANYWTPASLRAHSPSPTIASDDPDIDGTYLSNRTGTEIMNNVTDLSASGPIIPGMVYAYLLLEPRQSSRENFIQGGSQFATESSRDPFFGAKVDVQLKQWGRFEFTSFIDDRTYHESIFSADATSPESSGDVTGDATKVDHERGGKVFVGRYTVNPLPWLNLSTLYGRGSAIERDVVVGGVPGAAIIDATSGSNIVLSGVNQVLGLHGDDLRQSYRFDATALAGDHTIRAGIDYEKRSSEVDYALGGGIRYIYSKDEDDNDVVRLDYLTNSGEYSANLSAIYLEENWQVTPNFLLSLGLRNETFDYKNARGQTYAKLNNQLAPRFGFSFDPKGQGTMKFYGNAGRYYLPIFSNTAIRGAGEESFIIDRYFVLGRNPDNTPILGDLIDHSVLQSPIGDKPVGGLVTNNLKPMYQDEFILGFQSELMDQWMGNIKFTFRELKNTIEDTADAVYGNEGVYAIYPDANPDTLSDYTIFNPGHDVVLQIDTDSDGILETVNLGNLGFPKAVRKYAALQFDLQKQFSQKAFVSFSYVWSKTYGNYEGASSTDYIQDDSGGTIAYDELAFSTNAYGNLPSDRRHQLKLFGSWSVNDDFQLTSNMYAAAGAPYTAQGITPDSYYGYGCCEYLDPRGTSGKTPWVFNVDFGLRYVPSFISKDLLLSLDVFNVLNAKRALFVDSNQESDSGGPNDSYEMPTAYQPPRSAVLGVRYQFNIK